MLAADCRLASRRLAGDTRSARSPPCRPAQVVTAGQPLPSVVRRDADRLPGKRIAERIGDPRPQRVRHRTVCH